MRNQIFHECQLHAQTQPCCWRPKDARNFIIRLFFNRLLLQIDSNLEVTKMTKFNCYWARKICKICKINSDKVISLQTYNEWLLIENFIYTAWFTWHDYNLAIRSANTGNSLAILKTNSSKMFEIVIKICFEIEREQKKCLSLFTCACNFLWFLFIFFVNICTLFYLVNIFKLQNLHAHTSDVLVVIK